MYYKKMIGNKCYLSPINIEDYKEYTKWANDMEVSLGLSFPARVTTEEAEKEMLEQLIKREYTFSIIDKESDNLIGNIGFSKIDKIHQVGQIGIFIGNKDYWGKGYGKEAVNLILDFGFSILNLHNIYLRVFEFNKSAIKCYKRVGFKEVGRIREAKKIAGKRYDEIYMDILANEYESVYIKDLVEKRNKSE
ncbi:GNAT family N-acetyltransferase [Defluviitalea phaphyphila]|uniref:GNAT family N-acetyltransferase n=1 Tax=Defluviitalea phaphyphila TaxID=1473580 RepID=UPI0007303A1D|nr:GNAT family protein [Defluviitalea phaphyphila]